MIEEQSLLNIWTSADIYNLYMAAIFPISHYIQMNHGSTLFSATAIASSQLSPSVCTNGVSGEEPVVPPAPQT